jgi:hypothetical protein
MNKFGKKVNKPQPVNKKLYAKVLKSVKAKSEVWPSAYASGRLVQEYKKRGGTYHFGKVVSGLTRWFKEKWVNVCSKKKSTCARSTSTSARSTSKYPYCRPTVRVNSKTPKTVKEIPKNKLKEMCKLKKNKTRMKNV